MKIVVFGLSVTSSWGNGHATTFRALLAALHRRKHRIVFFEKDEEWYASNRDLPSPAFCDVRLFTDWRTILPFVRRELADCDVVILDHSSPRESAPHTRSSTLRGRSKFSTISILRSHCIICALAAPTI